MVQITQPHARRLALHSQLLDGRTGLPRGKEGVAQAIEKLGYVQIDTISVIERAHHHTLRTRCPDYHPEHLHELQAQDRRIFEYWGHAMSYLPMSDYRYYLPMMKAHRDPIGKWHKDRLSNYTHLMPKVLERVRAEGPLGSSDFLPPSGRSKQSGWWEWEPSKTALELLFWQGDLMITERKNFQRIYDLTERVLPGTVDASTPSKEEFGLFFVRRALQAYGIATLNEIVHHIKAPDRSSVSKALRALVDAGEVESVKVKGIAGVQHFAAPDALERSSKYRAKKPILRFLSPFDNLIIQRDRTSRLFQFDYTLECYVPAKKRKYGYFVLPVLCGEQFIGRLDPKADRKKKSLHIKSLSFEPGFDQLDALTPQLVKCLRVLAVTNGCDRIELGRVDPHSCRAPILNELGRDVELPV